MQRPTVVKPGVFSIRATADDRRGIFDMHNETILSSKIPVDVVFMGDSITEMWAIDVYFRSSAGLLVNRGIGGDRTPFGRRRLGADVLQLRPRLLVHQLGVNNSWDLDVWWDASQCRNPEEIENEIVEDNSAVVAASRAAGITVALCSILPTDVPFNGNTAVRNQIIVNANRRMQQVALQAGAIYVDYHSYFCDEDGETLRAGFADDGLHPHVLGYAIMARVLTETLATAGVSVITRRSWN